MRPNPIISHMEVDIPTGEQFNLRCATTLPVENAFADCKRKHGYASMQTMARQFSQMGLELVKRLLPSTVLGWVHHDAYNQRSWYPKLSQLQLDDLVAKVAMEKLKHIRRRAKEDHDEYKRAMKTATNRVEEWNVMRTFAALFVHAKQLTMRQRTTKMIPGTSPWFIWAGKARQKTSSHEKHGENKDDDDEDE